MLETITFTIPEILSLFGVAQCIYIITYMAFRAGKASHAGLPVLYFLVLASAFFSDFAQRMVGDSWAYYPLMEWGLWAFGAPLSVLLIIQIAQVTTMPAWHHYWVLLMPPLAFCSAWFAAGAMPECSESVLKCDYLYSALSITAGISGCICLLYLWTRRGLLSGLSSQKVGKERYWLILSLIIAYCFLIALNLFKGGAAVDDSSGILARTLIGLAFIYLMTTSLFRIYPKAVRMIEAYEREQQIGLSDEEEILAKKIENLLTLDKIYQEQAYSRGDLAKELDRSEIVISKIINKHFGKSFPQLLNEYRVEDAKRLLRETDAPVKIIGEDVGFNSLPSFNRVFKEFEGISPSLYRKKKSSRIF